MPKKDGYEIIGLIIDGVYGNIPSSSQSHIILIGTNGFYYWNQGNNAIIATRLHLENSSKIIYNCVTFQNINTPNFMSTIKYILYKLK